MDQNSTEMMEKSSSDITRKKSPAFDTLNGMKLSDIENDISENGTEVEEDSAEECENNKKITNIGLADLEPAVAISIGLKSIIDDSDTSSINSESTLVLQEHVDKNDPNAVPLRRYERKSARKSAKSSKLQNGDLSDGKNVDEENKELSKIRDLNLTRKSAKNGELSIEKRVEDEIENAGSGKLRLAQTAVESKQNDGSLESKIDQNGEIGSSEFSDELQSSEFKDDFSETKDCHGTCESGDNIKISELSDDLKTSESRDGMSTSELSNNLVQNESRASSEPKEDKPDSVKDKSDADKEPGSILANIIKGDLNSSTNDVVKPKRKQKARKSGFPSKFRNAGISADIKTVNLYPIADMELKLPEIGSALGMQNSEISGLSRDNIISGESTDKSSCTSNESTDSFISTESNQNNNVKKRRRRRLGQYNFKKKRTSKRKIATDETTDSETLTTFQDCKDEEVSLEGAPPSKKPRLEPPASNDIKTSEKKFARKSFPSSNVSSSVLPYKPIHQSVTSTSLVAPNKSSQILTDLGKRVITLQPPPGLRPVGCGQTPTIVTGVNNKGQSIVIPVVPISAESIVNTTATTVFFVPNNPSNKSPNQEKDRFNHPFLLKNPARPSSSSPVQPATMLPRLKSSVMRTTNVITTTTTATLLNSNKQMPQLTPANSYSTSTKNMVTMTSLLSSPPQLMKSSYVSPTPNRFRNKITVNGTAVNHMSSPIVTMLKTSSSPENSSLNNSPPKLTANNHIINYQINSCIEELPPPLCSCKVRGTKFANTTKVTFCQALDSIDGRVAGCSNRVSSGGVLVRPAVNVPFMAFCDQHQNRLKSHQCCPTCGHFCTQGIFYQCRNDISIVHQFHKECQILRRDGKILCPHCGELSAQYEVDVKYSEIKKQLQFQRERAKMTGLSFVKVRRESASSKEEEEKSIEIPSTKKRLSTKGLPLGPSRSQMELILTYMTAQRPKKLRLSAKNLYMVCKNGELDKVIFMLAEGFDPNCQIGEYKKRSPLHIAATNGHLAIVHCLLQAGSNPNVEDEELVKPIMCAAENNQVDIMRILIKFGAIIDARGEDGMTCIHLASKHGHLETLKYIIDEKLLDISTLDDGGWTALVWASEYKRVDTVKYLLSQGSDPNIRDNEENIALHWAAFSGSCDILELYMNRGCDLESMNEIGDRPLHVATRQNHYECVALLLARGANVDALNNNKKSPLECCSDNDSATWMALKVNKQLKTFAAKRSNRPERLLHRDLSFGKERTAMPVVNSIDDDDWPRDFMYVTANVETTQLNINRTITSLHNCQCEDDCSAVSCSCTRASIKCWYDKEGRLLPEFNLIEPPILFECNRSCRCWANCYNRVVQNGVLTRLQIFRTVGRGWGVRALLDIQPGTFICEYIGELISDSDADIREDDSYLFDLDNRDGETYCIDARKYGNVARFINHLCEPNIIPVKVFVDHQDLRFPHICFFSSREIKAGEELGFDYGEKFWVIKWKQFLCACGMSKCKYSSERIQQTLADYHKRIQEEELHNI